MSDRKVGFGDQIPEQPSVQTYRRDLNASALKFQTALEVYQSSSGDDQTRLKAIMDDQLNLIQAAIREIRTSGMHKQGEKVASDYRQFLSNNSEENFNALEHDIQTLQDYNKLGE